MIGIETGLAAWAASKLLQVTAPYYSSYFRCVTAHYLPCSAAVNNGAFSTACVEQGYCTQIWAVQRPMRTHHCEC